MPKYLGRTDFLAVFGFNPQQIHYGDPGLENPIDVFYCEQCNEPFWISPRVQKCLRKDVECPMCRIRKEKEKIPRWKFWRRRGSNVLKK